MILLLIVGAIIILPLIIQAGSEFGGADGMAEEAITEIAPEYEPWIEPFWEPPGGETESLLFSLQAAIGAGIMAYCFGYMKGKKDSKNAYNR